MKSYDVTIQTKPLQRYCHMVLFNLYVILTFESVDESYSVTIQMKPRQQYIHMVQFSFQHITKRKSGSFLEFLLCPLLVLKGMLSEHPS